MSILDIVAKISGEISEKSESLSIVCQLDTQEKYDAYLALKSFKDNYVENISAYLREEHIEPEEVSTDWVVINLKKQYISGALIYFFKHNAKSLFIEKDVRIEKLFIADLSTEESFATYGLEVLPMYENAIETKSVHRQNEFAHITTVKYVRDFSSGSELTNTIGSWIYSDLPSKRNELFDEWQLQSCRRILGAICNNLIPTGGGFEYVFNSPVEYKFTSSQIELSLFDALQEIAKWVFLSGTDIEARHLIMSNEIARYGIANAQVNEKLVRSIEAAKKAYEAYLHSTTKETLKVLVELRKGVIEEAQKYTQKTQELISGLWKELVISALPFSVKALDKNFSYLPNLFIFAGCVIFASIGLQIWLNYGYFNENKRSRAKWVSIISNCLSDEETKEIIDRPLAGLENQYLVTSLLVIIFGIFIVFSLFYMSHR